MQPRALKCSIVLVFGLTVNTAGAHAPYPTVPVRNALAKARQVSAYERGSQERLLSSRLAKILSKGEAHSFPFTSSVGIRQTIQPEVSASRYEYALASVVTNSRFASQVISRLQGQIYARGARVLLLRSSIDEGRAEIHLLERSAMAYEPLARLGSKEAAYNLGVINDKIIQYQAQIAEDKALLEQEKALLGQAEIQAINQELQLTDAQISAQLQAIDSQIASAESVLGQLTPP